MSLDWWLWMWRLTWQQWDFWALASGVLSLDSSWSKVWVNSILCVVLSSSSVICFVNTVLRCSDRTHVSVLIGGILVTDFLSILLHNVNHVKTNKVLCNISASTEILLDMVTRMNDQKMGLVHQLPFTTDQSGFAAAVEKVLFKRLHICYIGWPWQVPPC